MAEGNCLRTPCACRFMDDGETITEPCAAHAAWRNTVYERGRTEENEACAWIADAFMGDMAAASKIAQRIRARLTSSAEDTSDG